MSFETQMSKIDYENENVDYLTECKESILHYDWFIENIDSNNYKCSKVLESPIFPSIDILETSEWSLKMYFRQENLKNATYTKDSFISLYPNKHSFGEQIQSKINFALISHLKKEEIGKNRLIMKIDYKILNDENDEVSFGILNSINFDGKQSEQMFDSYVPSDIKRNDLNITFNCNLLIANNETQCLKHFTKKINWVINDYKSLFSLAEENSVESLRFDFCERNLTTNCKGYIGINDIRTKHRWSIHFYPKGRDSRYDGFFSILLKHISGPDVVASAQFIISKCNDSEIIKKKDIPPQFFSHNQRWGIGNFLNINDNPSLIKSSFKISCKLTIIDVNTSFIDCCLLSDSLNKYSTNFLTKLQNDYERKRNCDIILQANDSHDPIMLHKIVLLSCSKKIVDLEFITQKESNEKFKIIDLPFSRSCLIKFVDYLYRFELYPKYEFIDLIDLLKLSIDYSIPTLREDCEQVICRYQLSPENISTLLDGIDKRYLTKKLEDACCDFIAENLNDCLKNSILKYYLDNDYILRKILSHDY